MMNGSASNNTNSASMNANLSKENNNNGIGGLAASHLPDASPLLSVLRRDSSASTNSGGPTLQFENSANLLDELEDSDDDAPRSGEKRSGRRKIKIEYIEDKSRRHITFSKRKAGIMKKAYELSTLTGTQVLLLVASETGHVYTFATPKLQPLITKQEGKNLIQACLNSPDHVGNSVSVANHLQNQNHHNHQHQHQQQQQQNHPVQSHPHSHAHVTPGVPVDYGAGPFDADLTEEDLSTRSASTAAAAALNAYLPQSSQGGSAASVAAQVFMNPNAQFSATSPSPFAQPGNSQQQHLNHNHNQQQQQSTSNASYWNTPTSMYTPIPSKSQQVQQQQQQQQQMYHALLQQQQLYQQYHNQQQQQQQQQNQNHHQQQHPQQGHHLHKSHDSNNDS